MNSSFLIDTASSWTQVALYTPQGALWRKAWRSPQGGGKIASHNTLLAPLIEELLQESGTFQSHQLHFITLLSGPGSFTALRIALSLTKALSLAWEKPYVTVSAFELAASLFPQEENVLILRPVAQDERFFVMQAQKGLLQGEFEEVSLLSQKDFSVLQTHRLLFLLDQEEEDCFAEKMARVSFPWDIVRTHGEHWLEALAKVGYKKASLGVWASLRESPFYGNPFSARLIEKVKK